MYIYIFSVVNNLFVSVFWPDGREGKKISGCQWLLHTINTDARSNSISLAMHSSNYLSAVVEVQWINHNHEAWFGGSELVKNCNKVVLLILMSCLWLSCCWWCQLGWSCEREELFLGKLHRPKYAFLATFFWVRWPDLLMKGVLGKMAEIPRKIRRLA